VVTACALCPSAAVGGFGVGLLWALAQWAYISVLNCASCEFLTVVTCCSCCFVALSSCSSVSYIYTRATTQNGKRKLVRATRTIL
jgi:hypothetical protein